MKFYNRNKELHKLQSLREASFNDHSRLTVVTGRRRIGKTSLIIHDTGTMPMLYFFVGRKNEAALCAGFCREIEAKLGLQTPKMSTFEEVFVYLLQIGRTQKFTLIIDEFQEFANINPSIYSDLQNHWDQMRLTTHINLIVSGSIYSMMNKIFQDGKEPLFGRADAYIRLTPFSTDVVKEILNDYNPNYCNDDLLALYTVTGGVAKYIELLMDNGATTVDKIIEAVCDLDSPMRDEGRNILIEEFGKNYGTYFSILDAISSGRNTQAEIEAALGNKSLGGQLAKLEDTFEVIAKMRPIFAKPGSQTVRYYIKDQFFDFWFRYFEGNRQLIEMGLSDALKRKIKADYTTYSGKVLEKYFKQKLRESGEYREIGSYWESKPGKEQREVDIVAIGIDKKHALVAEVKRQSKEFSPESFSVKVEHLRTKILTNYDIEEKLFSLNDM